MTSKIIVLLERLKSKFSQKLLEETLDYFVKEDGGDDFYSDVEKSKLLLNGQDARFYKGLAKRFVGDLNNLPEFYFFIWEPVFYFFQPSTSKLLLEQGLELSEMSDAAAYIKGMIELDAGKPEIALFHFNRIQDYVVCYFLGLCYLELGNYENAIKQNLLFLSGLKEQIVSFDANLDPESDGSFEEDFLITEWNVYNDLGYLYNRTANYDEAKLYYEKGLEIISFEDSFKVKYFEDENEEYDTFTSFANNYLLCLEKLEHYVKCIEILNFIISKFPHDNYYLKRKEKFEEKVKHIGIGEQIIRRALPVKKPFGIQKHEQTKLLSKEKALENMIIEQIKYGFKVFGKSLEIYSDSNIFGRQYYISGVNGILDLLLIDKVTQNLYIVELKRNEAGIEVVEQIEKYMAGLSKQLGRKLRGIICLHKPDEQLKLLVRSKPDIELFTYYFDFKEEK